MIQIADLQKAVDDLETLRRKIFDDFSPLWDADEQSMQRALAVLHQLVREVGEP